MNCYAERDVLALADHYMRHVSAMTAEGLHDKADIAAELAWRDSEIERLNALLPVWQPIETAPKDTPGVAVYARMTCCGGGGTVVMVAGRKDGTWIYPTDHCFEFIHWMPLPAACRLPTGEKFECHARVHPEDVAP